MGEVLKQLAGAPVPLGEGSRVHFVSWRGGQVPLRPPAEAPFLPFLVGLLFHPVYLVTYPPLWADSIGAARVLSTHTTVCCMHCRVHSGAGSPHAVVAEMLRR